MVGRPLNSCQRPRDDRGWIIPTEGTKSRIAYALMQRGVKMLTIAKATGTTVANAHRTCWRIKNPERCKLWHREAYRNRKQSHDST